MTETKTKAVDITSITDEQLDQLLAVMRARKVEIMDHLRVAVAEFDRRATLRDMKRRYGDKVVQTITGAGGIESKEQVGEKKE